MCVYPFKGGHFKCLSLLPQCITCCLYRHNWLIQGDFSLLFLRILFTRYIIQANYKIALDIDYQKYKIMTLKPLASTKMFPIKKKQT